MNTPTASAVTWSMTQQPRLKARRIGQPVVPDVTWSMECPQRIEIAMVPHVPTVVPRYEHATLKDVERAHVLATLRANNGVRSKTARVLDIGVRTLQLKLKEWGYAGVRIP